MPANSLATIAIWHDATNVAAFDLSRADTGVRVRQVRAPLTAVRLPEDSPNDGDNYWVQDADGSSSAGNAIVIVPPAGTTIRGAPFFTGVFPFASYLVTFDADADDWTVLETQGPATVEELVLVVPFTFATPSPLVLAAIAPADVVTRAAIQISQTFDDPAATLTLGTALQPSLLLAANQNLPGALGQYETDELTSSALAGSLELAIAPGASTQGAGRVLLKIKP